MIRRSLCLGLLAVSACSPATYESPERAQEDRDVFVGHLISFDGQPVRSMLRARFYSTNGDDVADRYFLQSDCFDAGYFDQRHGVFLSGHSPIGADTENAPADVVRQGAERHKTRCPAEDPQNYTRFVELMYGGATLKVDGDRAQLVSKTGPTAELVRDIEPILVD